MNVDLIISSRSSYETFFINIEIAFANVIGGLQKYRP